MCTVTVPYRTYSSAEGVSSERDEPYLELRVTLERTGGDAVETALLVHPSNGAPPVGSRWRTTAVDDSRFGPSYVGVLAARIPAVTDA